MQLKHIVKEPFHLSGHLHVTGRSKFIGDDCKPRDMLFVKIVPSVHAHAKLLEINTKAAKEVKGVKAVLFWKDIPGKNQIGHPLPDQPLLAVNEVMYVGQPVAIVVADSEKIAEYAAKVVEIKYEKLPTILTIEEAVKVNDYYAPVRRIECGNIEEGFALSDYIIEDKITSGTQEHLYLETQRCWAIPGDDNEITLYASTQSTAAVQEIVAHVLGLKSKDITVDVKRLGGAFGGKEGLPANMIAALAALAAYKTRQPVELKLSRLEDMSWTGKRHPFLGEYKIGFSKDGKIRSYLVNLYANGGAYTDLSLAILERALFHADNSYFIPNFKVLGYACRTNLPPNTAFRGFGAPQGVFVIEHAIERVAHKLQIDPLTVREINLYKDGELAPYGQIVHEACGKELCEKLKLNCKYHELLNETKSFNQENKYIKRGIGTVPIKFGISFTASFLNQASSLIWIYSDGSLSLSHGGIEMGQEVNTKIAQIVANELGIDLSIIRVESANTKRVANASPTAASTGADLNGQAALNATKQLKERLMQAAIELFKNKFALNVAVENLVFNDNQIFDSSQKTVRVSFKELTKFAYVNQFDLGAHGFYKTPDLYFDRDKGQGRPFNYYVFGVCLVQAEVDVLTGSNRLVKVYIVHEMAKSINKEIDRGQITGAFFQGFGWCTMEEINYDKNGCYLSTTPSTYKIPAISDLPEVFAIEMVAAERKYSSVMGSKAIGEPPLLYGTAVYFAIKHAIEACGNDESSEANLSMPATSEAILTAVEGLK